MNRVFRLLTAGVALIAAACTDASLTAPAVSESATAESRASAPPLPHAISVLNWNIYVGTDVDVVIRALNDGDPTNDLEALNAAIAELVATDFPTRASAIADDIARRRPDVIGLQEVAIIDIDLAAVGGPVVQLDFLAMLQAELALRNLDYLVAAMVRNIDARPVLPPGLPADLVVRTIDHDALLVATDRVTVTSRVERNYNANVGVVAPGVELVRGFVMIDADVDHRSYRIANTHLEPDLAGNDLSELRAAQAAELMAAVGPVSPAIVMGDLNDAEGSLMHQVVTGAGFVDMWRAKRPGVPGLTCCHLSNLANDRALFDQRIDYVFVRGIPGPSDRIHGTIQRLGVLPFEKVEGPFYRIWPSDHAGLTAVIVTRLGLVAGTGAAHR